MKHYDTLEVFQRPRIGQWRQDVASRWTLSMGLFKVKPEFEASSIMILASERARRRRHLQAGSMAQPPRTRCPSLTDKTVLGQVVLFHFTPERGPAPAQQFGRPGAVAPAPQQGFRDHAPLHFAPVEILSHRPLLHSSTSQCKRCRCLRYPDPGIWR